MYPTKPENDSQRASSSNLWLTAPLQPFIASNDLLVTPHNALITPIQGVWVSQTKPMEIWSVMPPSLCNSLSLSTSDMKIYMQALRHSSWARAQTETDADWWLTVWMSDTFLYMNITDNHMTWLFMLWFALVAWYSNSNGKMALFWGCQFNNNFLNPHKSFLTICCTWLYNPSNTPRDIFTDIYTYTHT